MKDINTLPLETQLVLERLNRTYRLFNALHSRKPTFHELAEELGLDNTDMEYYICLGKEYSVIDSESRVFATSGEALEEFINCNDDIPVKYARDGFYVNLDFDIYEPDYKFNPAKTLLPKLYKNSVPELTKKELKMLKLFWGILDGHAKTYQQMSLILEIKTKKIKQMLKDATRKLVTE